MFPISHLSVYYIIFWSIDQRVSTAQQRKRKSEERDDTFSIWLDALPQLSITQFLIGV
jgi:hypothetical protein